MEKIESKENELDLEWIQLIQEARNLGIEIEEIREFLSSQKETETERLL
ncbi:anti-repressor SinI family protein [Bacillus benzoevorans]|uniref:DNA-binding transcriptional MerR regulator n=1 Tax=Bacillus benzoevorans TaxID=1456 RepID=A0A7X0HUX4_9BACI|nr:DNA-binding transcriptional MerR regulator [Bacillus benzoevorans]